MRRKEPRALGGATGSSRDRELSSDRLAVSSGPAPPFPHQLLPWTGRTFRPGPPVLCPACPHRGIFYALGKFDVVVTGDIGCYCLGVFPPLKRIDTILCMGGGVSMAHGMQIAERMRGSPEQSTRRIVGMVGDSTFFHSGITGLLDISYNKSAAVIIVVDNRTTAMTGHQEHPGTGRTLMGEPTVAASVEDFGRACGMKNIATVDPYDLKSTIATLRHALDSNEPWLIVSRSPCPLATKKSVGSAPPRGPGAVPEMQAVPEARLPRHRVRERRDPRERDPLRRVRAVREGLQGRRLRHRRAQGNATEYSGRGPAMSKATSIVMVGVGGQGILLATQITARAAIANGHDVKTNEVHGMAQRGGSVVAQIRFGDRVYSPLVPEGTAQVLASLERIEALRFARYLAPDGLAVVSSQAIVPGDRLFRPGRLPGGRRGAPARRLPEAGVRRRCRGCGETLRLPCGQRHPAGRAVHRPAFAPGVLGRSHFPVRQAGISGDQPARLRRREEAGRARASAGLTARRYLSAWGGTHPCSAARNLVNSSRRNAFSVMRSRCPDMARNRTLLLPGESGNPRTEDHRALDCLGSKRRPSIDGQKVVGELHRADAFPEPQPDVRGKPEKHTETQEQECQRGKQGADTAEGKQDDLRHEQGRGVRCDQVAGMSVNRHVIVHGSRGIPDCPLS